MELQKLRVMWRVSPNFSFKQGKLDSLLLLNLKIALKLKTRALEITSSVFTSLINLVPHWCKHQKIFYFYQGEWCSYDDDDDDDDDDRGGWWLMWCHWCVAAGGRCDVMVGRAMMMMMMMMAIAFQQMVRPLPLPFHARWLWICGAAGWDEDDVGWGRLDTWWAEAEGDGDHGYGWRAKVFIIQA